MSRNVSFMKSLRLNLRSIQLIHGGWEMLFDGPQNSRERTTIDERAAGWYRGGLVSGMRRISIARSLNGEAERSATDKPFTWRNGQKNTDKHHSTLGLKFNFIFLCVWWCSTQKCQQLCMFSPHLYLNYSSCLFHAQYLQIIFSFLYTRTVFWVLKGTLHLKMNTHLFILVIRQISSDLFKSLIWLLMLWWIIDRKWPFASQ